VANVNLGRMSPGGSIDAWGTRIDTTDAVHDPGTAVLWSVAPERVALAPAGRLTGMITDVAELGTSVDYFVRVNPELELRARTAGPLPLPLAVGGVCGVEVPADAVQVWTVDAGSP
jgi:hypothetical protein